MRLCARIFRALDQGRRVLRKSVMQLRATYRWRGLIRAPCTCTVLVCRYFCAKKKMLNSFTLFPPPPLKMVHFITPSFPLFYLPFFWGHRSQPSPESNGALYSTVPEATWVFSLALMLLPSIALWWLLCAWNTANRIRSLWLVFLCVECRFWEADPRNVCWLISKCVFVLLSFCRCCSTFDPPRTLSGWSRVASIGRKTSTRSWSALLMSTSTIRTSTWDVQRGWSLPR